MIIFKNLVKNINLKLTVIQILEKDSMIYALKQEQIQLYVISNQFIIIFIYYKKFKLLFNKLARKSIWNDFGFGDFYN